MEARADPVHAEQHHSDEAGLEKERCQHLVSEKRPNYIRSALGENAPIGADLVGHDEPSHHPHRKAEGEQVNPEPQQVAVDRSSRAQPQNIEDHDKAGDADCVCRPQDVEPDREGELGARDY